LPVCPRPTTWRGRPWRAAACSRVSRIITAVLRR
jgi:hypothetical protein